jgi:ribosomal protein S12 methylthiotransferase accessory factor
MLRVPRFRPSCHVEIVPPEGVYLVSEAGAVLLRGERNCRVAALIDGVNTADDIVDALAGAWEPAEVYYVLLQLETKGYVVEGEAAPPIDRAAFFDALGVDAATAERRLRDATVALSSLGSVTTAALARALQALGLTVGAPGDVTIVLVDDYLQPALDDFNVAALRTGRPWLLAKPVGTVLWIGPMFQPGATGCWRCLAHRLERNREVETYVQRRTGKSAPLPTSRAALGSSVEVGLHLAATEAVKWLARGGVPPSDGALITFDTVRAESQRHALVRRPQCPACGDGSYTPSRAPAPVVLRSGLKRFVEDGGHRVVAPAATLARYQRQVSPITGAVAHVTPLVPETDDLLHAYMAGHNFALHAVSLPSLRRGLRSKAAGKGVSDVQARASALCEAVERYSGVFAGDEIRTRASLRQLGDQAIHPNACMLFSERQYATRAEWNARQTGFHFVPDPLDPDAVLDWSPVWSLTRETFRYLPTAYLYFAYPRASGAFFCGADSNGNAAGNSLEEATLQGFLELVERDAVAVWWYNRLRRPAVDLDSFDLPYVRALQARYAELGREFWVLDLTGDLGIPAFGAITRRIDKPVEDIVLAFGAHLDPRIALLRAITEMNQFLPAVLPIRPDGSGDYAYDDPECLAWWRTATVAAHPYLVPDPQAPARRAGDFARSWGEDLRDDLLACRALVEGRGLEMLVLDQTRPDIGMPVVKVVVPGLRHFWARFARGRLYDVPVALGWLGRPLAEDALNPIPLFV